MRRSNRRGITLIETIVAGTVLVLLMTLGLQAFISLFNTSADATTIPPVQSDAIDVVNKIAGQVRRAPLCTSAGTGTVSAALVSGTASSVAVVTGTGTTATTYSVDGGGNFLQTISGTLTILYTKTVSLTLSYCIDPNSTGDQNAPYITDTQLATSGNWVSSVSSANAAQLKAVIAMKVTATVTRSGKTFSYSALVKLRNSPMHVLG